MEAQTRKKASKSKSKPVTRKIEQRRHARLKAVLIKLAKGVSYPSILKDLKKWVKPKELSVTVQGIRKTRSKDLLMEVKYAAKDKERIDSAFQKSVDPSDTLSS